MLVRAAAGTTDVIGQLSHAWLSGQLARAWGNAAFAPPQPREEVCLAAEQHDVGMAGWDEAPRLDAERGVPVSFMRMTVREHLALWGSAPDRLLSASHYAALLVSMHGSALYARRDLARMAPPEAEAVRGYLAAERARQQQLIARLDADREQVQRNQRLLWAWDGLSLALCLGWTDHVAAGLPAAAGADADVALEWLTRPDHERPQARLRPWPLSEAEVLVRCEARRLEAVFTDEGELLAALGRARPRPLEFRLTAS